MDGSTTIYGGDSNYRQPTIPQRDFLPRLPSRCGDIHDQRRRPKHDHQIAKEHKTEKNKQPRQQSKTKKEHTDKHRYMYTRGFPGGPCVPPSREKRGEMIAGFRVKCIRIVEKIERAGEGLVEAEADQRKISAAWSLFMHTIELTLG